MSRPGQGFSGVYCLLWVGLESFILVIICSQCESQACEGFREQLEALICKAKEAEEVLKESDPVGTPDLTVVQTSLEKLKVQSLLMTKLQLEIVFNHITFLFKFFY